jgi:hypothetical protein
LAEGCDYPIAVQAQLLPALAALHNFIQVNNSQDLFNCDDDDTLEAAQEPDQTGYAYDDEPIDLHGPVSPEERCRAEARRDKIAAAMWESYIQYRADLGLD